MRQLYLKLRGLWHTSPAWVVCSMLAIYLILALRPGPLFSGLWGVGFGGLGIAIDRWLEGRRRR
jgi:hypothetical protein